MRGTQMTKICPREKRWMMSLMMKRTGGTTMQNNTSTMEERMLGTTMMLVVMNLFIMTKRDGLVFFGSPCIARSQDCCGHLV